MVKLSVANDKPKCKHGLATKVRAQKVYGRKKTEHRLCIGLYHVYAETLFGQTLFFNFNIDWSPGENSLLNCCNIIHTCSSSPSPRAGKQA